MRSAWVSPFAAPTAKREGTDLRHEEREGPPDYHREDYYIAEQRLLEGSLGFGIVTERADIDLAIDLVDQRAELDKTYETERDTTFLKADSDGEETWGFAGRGIFRFAGGAELIAFGNWIDPEYRVNGAAGNQEDTLEVATMSESGRWMAGAGVRFPTKYIDQVGITGYYRTTQQSKIIQGYYVSSFHIEKRKVETASIAASLRHGLIRNLQMMAGGRATYEIYELVREGKRTIQNTEIFAERTETLRTDFSWGASYEWKRLLLLGQVSNVLELDRLFMSLDIHIRL